VLLEYVKFLTGVVFLTNNNFAKLSAAGFDHQMIKNHRSLHSIALNDVVELTHTIRTDSLEKRQNWPLN
jgi:hypothetical protein